MFAIPALGLAACYVLGLMMRQVAELDGDRREAPFLPALRAQFGARLNQPLRLRVEATAAGPRWIATAHVADEVDGARLAEAIGSEVWLHTLRAGPSPSEVLVRVKGAVPGPIVTVAVPPPALTR